jgi:hypothetical protein
MSNVSFKAMNKSQKLTNFFLEEDENEEEAE